MITLKVINPHWIKGRKDDPEDQCAHGSMQFSVDPSVYISENDGDWTISAAGLHLLRTIESDHTKECSVAEGNFLIPCDGFSVFPSEESRYKIVIFGCDTGIDPEIRHKNGEVVIQLNESTSVVSFRDWIVAVLDFVEQVESFYNNCSPKTTIDDEYERKGWAMFWKEWNERKNNATKLLETF